MGSSDRRPRVLVTRAPEQAGPLVAGLEAAGCDVLTWPLLTIAEPLSWTACDDALTNLCAGDWLVVASANAVTCTLDRARSIGQPLPELRVAAIGQGTARVCAEQGLAVTLIPERQDAEGLLAALHEQLSSAARVLLPRADNARPYLVRGLRAVGCEVADPVVYRSLPRNPGPLPGRLAAVTLASSATAHRFLVATGGVVPQVQFVAIGPRTAATCRDLGLEPLVMAPSPDPDGLVAAVTAAIAG